MSLQISESVIWQDTDSGVSLYNTETGNFLSLNDTGARIWRLIAEGSERQQVISQLSLRFAGTHAAMAGLVRTDVNEFIDSMVSGGLVAEEGHAP